MIVRDKDVLVVLTTRHRVHRVHHVPTVDEDAWRKLEPVTAHPAAAPEGGPRARGRGHPRRRADEPHRAGNLVEAGHARTNGEGDCRSRRAPSAAT